uniref:Serine/arginine repetitive matrix protein 1-like n=1 Tax=Cyprinodon variegatus TaxID=28743 RepID=A0A3Q2D9M8_CYPVA
MFLFVCCYCHGSFTFGAPSSIHTPPLLPVQLFNLGSLPGRILATTRIVCPLIHHLCSSLNAVPSQPFLALITTNYPQQDWPTAPYCSIAPTFEVPSQAENLNLLFFFSFVELLGKIFCALFADPVVGVILSVPSQPVEEKNVSLTCTWSGGTEVTTQWAKDGTAITPDSRIIISVGSLVINPASRDDTGDYTCTASNNVSAQTSTKRLTVYYGPDTPVLTVDSPKECVGGGDVKVGQTVRLTCTSDSLPPATFSWQRAGQTISSGGGSGVLSLQTFSTNESGQYVCTATNTITRGTSTQGYDLAIVEECFNGGEVAGIVIGAFLALLLIVLLIVFLVVRMKRNRGKSVINQHFAFLLYSFYSTNIRYFLITERELGRNVVFVQEVDPIRRTVPQDPQTNFVRNLDRGLQPPLYEPRRQENQPERLITNNLENRANLRATAMNRSQDFEIQQHNSRNLTNSLLPNATPNSNPNNSFDNPAFTPLDSPNANRALNLQQQQQQNPNVLIQTMPGQGSNQPPAVQVSLNALPNSNIPNSNAQLPTINVNLNSYPGNGQTPLQESSFPPDNQAFNGVRQTQNNFSDTRQLNHATQSRRSYPNNRRPDGHVNPNFQGEPGLIPTGYTHFNNNITTQRNETTQTYQQDPESHRRPDRESRQHESTPRSRQRQIPWDLLRGTPAYPSGTPERARAHIQPESTSDLDYSADYTIRPPIREGRTLNRTPPQNQTVTRRRTPPRHDPPSEDSQTQTYHADDRHPNTTNVTPPGRSHRTQRSPRTDRENTQREIRGSQSALRQETTHSSYPQAMPLMSQQASAGHTAVSQEPATQQGPTTSQSTDTRALADPNHLQQPHMEQQHIAAPAQTRPGRNTHTQPVMQGAIQPIRGGANPVPVPPAQPNPSNLTQAALKAHTERAKVFQNRRQQTQATLIHSGAVQIGATAAGGRQPPAPPPPIPLAEFQTLPKARTQHKSPTRVPQPLRQNMPAAQRHHGAPRHNTAMPHNHHGHVHAGAHRHGHVHARGHGHPAHAATWQQQAHRGRPR